MSIRSDTQIDGGGIHDGLRYADVPDGLLDQDCGISMYRPAVVPPGYRLIDVERIIGHGPRAFAAAAEGLANWRMHERAGFRVAGDDGGRPDPVDLGQRVLLRPTVGPARLLRITAPCLVVATLDRPGHQWGFAYATLAGHPECGEESFVLTLDPTDATVRARICAVSRPGSRLTRLAGPLGRAEQDRATGRYLQALRDLAG